MKTATQMAGRGGEHHLTQAPGDRLVGRITLFDETVGVLQSSPRGFHCIMGNVGFTDYGAL